MTEQPPIEDYRDGFELISPSRQTPPVPALPRHVPCSVCFGAGRVTERVNGRTIRIACERCKGMGTVELPPP